jgi:hypothetical protein
MLIMLLLLALVGGAMIHGAARAAAAFVFCGFAVLFLICAFSVVLLKLAIAAMVILALVAALIIMARNRAYVLLAALALAGSLALTGCRTHTAATAGSDPISVSATLTGDLNLVNGYLKPCVRHKLLVEMDETGSRVVNGIVTLTPQQVQQLVLEVSSRCGGEVAWGTITQESRTRPFIRCHFDPSDLGSLPEAPPATGNVFVLKRKRGEYEKGVQDLAAKVHEWQQNTQAARDRCAEQVSALLSGPLAGRTDIGGALSQAKLYFDENEAGAASHQALLLCTDGEDNVNRPVPTSLGRAEMVLVNSAGKTGMLRSYAPHRFENTDAALRYLFRTEGERL